MLVVLPYSKPDYAQALKNAQWIGELGPYPLHEILLVRDKLCEELPNEAVAGMGFGKVQQIVVVGDGWNKWPESPNLMFRTAAKHIEFTCPQPWFWLEADAVPLRKSWLDEIAAEYQAAGKPFLGDYVDVQNVPGFCPHMSGVGVYPGQMTRHAGEAMLAHEQAWDVVAANQIVPKMHKSKLIQHGAQRFDGTKTYLDWKNPKFDSLEQVRKEIRPEAVVFHASKDGAIIDLLRAEQNNLSDRCLTAVQPLAVEARPIAESVAQNLTCDIFIKSYPPDYGWLEYCLRSIDKFCSGFNRCLVVAPGCDESISVDRWAKLTAMNADFAIRREYGKDEYLSQEVFKLHADTYTGGDCIAHIDSDTIFVRPVTPQSYFTNGRINWMMTPYSMVETPWKPITEKFLGCEVEFEFMRRAPVLLPRWIYAGIREFCQQQHGRTLEQYIMEQPHRAFSEYNALGAFAYYFHWDKFNWINTGEVPEKDWPELTVLQKKSWDGLTPEIKAEFETILSSGVESIDKAPSPLNCGSCQSPIQFAVSADQNSLHIHPSNEGVEGSFVPTPARESTDSQRETLKEPIIRHGKVEYGSETLQSRQQSGTEIIKINEKSIVSSTTRLNQADSQENLVQNAEKEKPMPTMTTIQSHLKSAGSVEDVILSGTAQAIRQTKEGWWIINGDQWISKWVEETGRLDHDQNLLPSILPHIPEGGVVVDAGANIGSHTIAYLEKVGENGRVLAIEPNEDAWDCLRRNCPRAMIRGNTALWDKQKKLRLVKDANAGASYVEENEQGDITGVMLDTLIKGTVNRVDLIKLDCEGSEVRALQGAVKTIVKFRPKLVIEVNQEALQRQGTHRSRLFAWLETHRYISKILQDNCTPESPMYDLLCVPKERPVFGKAPDCSSDATNGDITPWDSNAESIGEIKRLSARLKTFCTAPAYIRRVRDELALAGVVKKK